MGAALKALEEKGGVAAVAACANLIGGSIASLPLHFYKRGADGSRQRDQASPLWWLFNERPCANWSAAAWWQFVSDSRMFHGDGFALMNRSTRGDRILSIEPWHPAYVQVDLDGDGRLLYEFHPRPGVDPVGARVRVREQDDVLHIPSAGFDGRRSPSMLRSALNHAAAAGE